jgi:DNA-binding transcriptional regulator GbsR (MarR family)
VDTLKTGNLTEQENEFIERMGMSSQADGLSRIAGRIWATLIISKEPLSSTQLAKLLSISKGSVSTNTRVLESLDIINRQYIAGERQEHFSIRNKPYRLLVEGQIKRFEAAREFLADSRSKLPDLTVKKRLEELENFYKAYGEACKAIITQLETND